MVDFKLENVLLSLHSLKNNGPRLHYVKGMESYLDILLYVNNVTSFFVVKIIGIIQ